jgi:glycosyltransferase involved in cell wall biosynthesis
MRVVHVVTAFPRDDEDVITPWLGELLLAQREAGIEAEVLAPAYRGGGATEWRGVPVHRFRYAPRALETLTHDETVPDRLRSRPSYAALLPGYMIGGTVGALRVARSRPDVFHVHWPLPHAWFGAVGRALGGSATGLVSSFYSVELNWVVRRLPALLPFLRWSIESADVVTAISSSTAAAVGAVSPRRVDVIPFPAATSPGDAALGRREGGTDVRVLFVGRLVERKGVEVLIEAVSRLTERLDVRLTIVGDGPRAAAISELVRSSGLEDRVTLTGRVDDAELRAAYETADVFALPAIVDRRGDTEGLGVVLLEALEFGVPVVASEAGGIPDIVRDGETGWLVPPGDADALARAIEDVASDRSEAARRVEQGRELVRRDFSMTGIVSSLAAVYERAVGRRVGGRS